MKSFFILEAGNLTIAAFFFLIAVIVATRPFVRTSVKKAIFMFVIGFFTFIVGGHYYITSERMESVKSAFSEGKDVVCENRMHRKAAQGIVINQKTSWSLDGDEFVNPDYNRGFHAARCIVKTKVLVNLEK